MRKITFQRRNVGGDWRGRAAVALAFAVGCVGLKIDGRNDFDGCVGGNVAFATEYFLDSAGGNDANDGKSPETAWRSLSRLDKAALEPGDVVRFRRDRECGGTLGFGQGFLFTGFMYLFAALFTTVAHYIYFRYLDNGLIVSTYQDMLTQMAAVASTDDMKASLDQFQQALDIIAQLSPVEISIQLITQNIFYCTLLALPTALLVRRSNKNQQTQEQP